MSKQSARIAIENALLNSIPSIDPEMTIFDQKWDDGIANEALRAIVKMNSLRSTKEAQYKMAESRIKDDKLETLNAIDSEIYKLEKKLEAYSAPRLSGGRVFMLPDGSVKFRKSSSVEIKCDGGVLENNLKALLKSQDPDLKACVEVKILPKLNGIKSAIISKKLECSWASVINSTTVKYFGADEKDYSEDEEPGREKIGPAPAMVVDEPMAVIDAPSGPDAATVPQDAPQQPEAKDEGSAAEPAPPASPAPSDVDLKLRPRIFSPPKDSHFDAPKLESNAIIFSAMDIKQLLSGQSKVLPEHVQTLGIDVIKSGFAKSMQTLGMSRDEIRRWVAYHMGQDFSTLDPSKIEDRDWRKLLALSIHAISVKEKYPVREDAPLSQGG